MSDAADRLARALTSLDGLSVGDAFGQRAFADPSWVWARTLPTGPWAWTDDTAMACAVVEILATAGRIDPDALAQRLAAGFIGEPHRGYGAGAAQLLVGVARGEDWRTLAGGLFGGRGSYGNGAAMRVAPLGGWFADDPERAAEQARAQAAVTHAHVEGAEAAVAVAWTAARLAAVPGIPAEELLQGAAAIVAPSETRARLEAAATIDPVDLSAAVTTLGTGRRISGFDTVPFCVWVVAHRRTWDDALFTTAQGFGDVDTTCAIVGGMLGVPCGGPPAAWLARREALPETVGSLRPPG